MSQSGAVGTFIFATMVALGVGVRYFANTGNEADVTAGEVLGKLAQANDVDVVIGHIEDARRLDVLESAAATADRLGKPMILLKAGATAEGARAVGLHTGSKPGSDADFNALVERHGAIRVESMEAAADAALAFRPRRRATGRRLAIITSSGGASALTTDAAVQLGSRSTSRAKKPRRPSLPDAARVRLDQNPFDLTGALLTDEPLIERVLSKVIADRDIDMVLVVVGNADRNAEALIARAAQRLSCDGQALCRRLVGKQRTAAAGAAEPSHSHVLGPAARGAGAEARRRLQLAAAPFVKTQLDFAPGNSR